MMWPFSQPKCPICRGELVPHSGTIGHAAYRCPTCIQANKTTAILKEMERTIAYNKATIAHYDKEQS